MAEAVPHANGPAAETPRQERARRLVRARDELREIQRLLREQGTSPSELLASFAPPPAPRRLSVPAAPDDAPPVELIGLPADAEPVAAAAPPPALQAPTTRRHPAVAPAPLPPLLPPASSHRKSFTGAAAVAATVAVCVGAVYLLVSAGSQPQGRDAAGWQGGASRSPISGFEQRAPEVRLPLRRAVVRPQGPELQGDHPAPVEQAGDAVAARPAGPRIVDDPVDDADEALLDADLDPRGMAASIEEVLVEELVIAHELQSDVQVKSAEASLIARGEAALGPARAALRSEHDPGVRRSLLRVMAAVRRASPDRPASAFDAATRAAMLGAIGRAGTGSGMASVDLRELLEDRLDKELDPETRERLLEALSRIEGGAYDPAQPRQGGARLPFQ
jgi:hypothetical protein